MYPRYICILSKQFWKNKRSILKFPYFDSSNFFTEWQYKVLWQNVHMHHGPSNICFLNFVIFPLKHFVLWNWYFFNFKYGSPVYFLFLFSKITKTFYLSYSGLFLAPMLWRVLQTVMMINTHFQRFISCP